MAQKSILEQALLQVGQLEEAVKANAKGILASTMKEELNSLLKEQEDEKDPEEEEKDVPEIPGDEKSSISGDDDSEELPAETGNELEEPEMEPSDEEDSDDVLDMTGASEAEVMKVFKAMKPEDGIVVKKEGGNIQFSDGDNEYIIKLDGEGDDHEAMETPGEEAAEHSDEETPEFPEGLAESEKDEIVYEIELDDNDDDDKQTETTEGENSPFDKKVSGKRVEAKENVSLPTKAPNKSDPFDKSGKEQGAKLRSTEVKEQEVGVDKWSGTPLKGTSNPQIKEPGKGGSKVTQSEKHDGTPVKGTKPAETKEPGKGGKNAQQVEKHPGTPIKGEGKPVMKEPKEQQMGYENKEAGTKCKGCGKEMEATEAARTKANPHGNKPEDGPKRAGLPSKKTFKAGSTVFGTDGNMGVVSEELETLRKQNTEYKKALILFKDKLNEVAVFNANLAYATRLFTEHSTTKQEKLNILKRFDSVSVITESRTLYNTIKTELETGKPLSETVAEKITSTPKTSASEVLSEAKAYENPQFKRMKDLMNKIK